MRWTLSEFVFEMRRDSRRKVFFVEGVRDQSFWSNTINVPRGVDTVIYPISFLSVRGSDDGERGRLVRCADDLSTSCVSDRLKFFADADFDRILEKATPPNLWLTDGRDFESYFFWGRCLHHICDTLAPGVILGDQDVYSKLRLSISQIARPIGVLRLAARRNEWALAFQRTFERRGISRFILSSGVQAQLDLDRLIRTLLQNSVDVVATAADISAAFEIEMERQSGEPCEQIVHGKDLVRLIAWYFDIAESFATSFVLLSIATEIALIRAAPNVHLASKWIEAT